MCYDWDMNRNVFLSAVFLLLGAFHSASAETLETLLSGYLANDGTIKSLTLTLCDKELSCRSAKLSRSFSVQLSSGTVTVTAGDQLSVRLKPSASLSLPQASNLSLTLSSDISAPDDSGIVRDTSLGIGVDIFSGAMASRRVALLKAERELLEAQRSLQDGFLSQEKAFYSGLKALYEAAAKLSSAEKDYYDKLLSFEQVKVQGFEPQSLKYRQTNLEVLTARHSVDSCKKALERDVRIFARRCGVPYTAAFPQDFLPESIPQVEELDVLDFPKERYTKIESASWTSYINGLSRKAEKMVTVTGSTGYTFANSGVPGGKDTIDVGAAASIADSALKLSAGISEPVDFSSPVYSFGISVDPTKFFLHNITAQQRTIAAAQEQLAMEAAESSYDEAVVARQTALDNLRWQLAADQESYDMYRALERDTMRWFREGIVSESDYKAAVVNREKYRIQCVIDSIERIMYNNETKLLFVRDEEL